MPTVNKVSVLGFQQAVNMPLTNPRFMNVYINDFRNPPRNQRLGTVLVCLNQGNIEFPVATAHKLYGHGLVLGNVPDWPAIGLEVWIHWFVAGYAYQAVTPG